MKKYYKRDTLEILLKKKQMPADIQELIWSIAYRIRNAKNISEAHKIADEIESHFERLDKIKNDSGISE
jgi:hypothetical protein